MKKYLILILSIAIFACNQKNGFEIKVKLDGADGKVLLEKISNEQWVSVDTADLKDGVAVLTGEVDYPSMYYLSVVGERPKTAILVENSEMTVTGNADSLNMVKITGSKSQDDLNSLIAKLRAVSSEYMGIYQQAREAGEAGDSAKSRMLMDQVLTIYNSIPVIQEDFIKNNPESFATPYILSSIAKDMELEKLDSLLSGLDPKLDVVPVIAALKEQVAPLKTVGVGKPAIDFTMNDPDGNPVKFSDVYSKNEVTLLDFWAGWCSPCRQENPNVVAVYNDYKDKGFTVFGVSLDRTKDEWLKAISDDGLTWTHVSDLAFWNTEIAQKYFVHSIPSNLLVDKNGIIIARNQRGEDLRKTVAKILD